jgi:uncharacterized protein YbcI
MGNSDSPVAKQIARVASTLEERRTGHAPKSVGVTLNGDTVVIVLHGALSPAEKAMARSPAGAAQLREYHQQLFAVSAEALRQEIGRITGAEVRTATAEIETMTGPVMQFFATGTIVQMFLLARSVPADAWNGAVPGETG